MPDLSKRSEEAEIMDDLNYTGTLMDRTLSELEVINKWLGGNNVTVNGLKKLLDQKSGGDCVTIADLGCGRGDMLRLIGDWAKKSGYCVRLVGIDANPYIVQAAKENLLLCPDIELYDINIFSPEFQALKFDIVIGTLFFHHFTDQELIQFFRQLKSQVTIGFLINDIHRHALAYYSIRLLTRIFSKSSMVKFDAPLSVRRAFKKDELKQILEKAGIGEFAIRWRWAFRWQVLVYSKRRSPD